MRFNENAQLDPSQVEDRRGGGIRPAGAMMVGGGGLGLLILLVGLFFGVDPAFQGTGLGSRLIETGHAKADAAGERVWLETFTAENVRWYEGRGFRVVSVARVPGSAFTIWGLIREPQRTAADR